MKKITIEYDDDNIDEARAAMRAEDLIKVIDCTLSALRHHIKYSEIDDYTSDVLHAVRSYIFEALSDYGLLFLSEERGLGFGMPDGDPGIELPDGKCTCSKERKE